MKTNNSELFINSIGIVQHFRYNGKKNRFEICGVDTVQDEPGYEVRWAYPITESAVNKHLTNTSEIEKGSLFDSLWENIPDNKWSEETITLDKIEDSEERE